MDFPMLQSKLNRPGTFYKYAPVEDWIEQFFRGESLQFSSRQKFNDPFDCRPGFRVETGKEAINILQRGLRKQDLSPAKRLLRVKQTIRKLGNDDWEMPETERRLDATGVLCLATEWDNALMWSHYAKHHRGICIGFQSDKDIFRGACPVIYSDELPIVSYPTSAASEVLYEKTFLTKAKCWSYEKEWRIIKPSLNDDVRDATFRNLCSRMDILEARLLSDQRGPGIYRFSNTAIESVSLGMRISKDDEDRVMNALLAVGLNIPVYKISPPVRTYSLLRAVIKQPFFRAMTGDRV